MESRQTDAALTVRSLLEFDLGIEVLGGHAGLDRPVVGVCVRDLEDPTPWMVPGTLLLTTGPTLEAAPESGVRLVRLLARRDMAGVGIAITPHVREVPAAMVAAAEQAGLPLLTVPSGTPLRLVTDRIEQALASRDLHRLKRTLALQQNLVDTLISEKSVAGLVSRLGDLLGLAVVLLDAQGREEAGSSPGVSDELVRAAWAAYRRRGGEGSPGPDTRVLDCWVTFREVRLQGAVEHVLLGIGRHDAPASGVASEAFTFVRRLLEAELATLESAGLKLRRGRAQVLERLLARPPGDDAELAERMLQYGIDVAEKWRVVVFAPRAVARPSGLSAPAWGATLRSAKWYTTSAAIDATQHEPVLPEDALDALDLLLDVRSRPFLTCRTDDQLALLVPDGLPGADTESLRGPVTALAEALRTRLRLPAVAAGFSDALTGVASVPRAASQARLALAHGDVDETADVAVTAFDDLGGRYRLLESMPDELLEQLTARVLGRLWAGGTRAEVDLASTLHAFLAHGCSTADTAAALYVHRNTLRKRLARIEEFTGISLASTGGLVEVYLSARAADVLAARRASAPGAAAHRRFEHRGPPSTR